MSIILTACLKTGSQCYDFVNMYINAMPSMKWHTRTCYQGYDTLYLCSYGNENLASELHADEVEKDFESSSQLKFLPSKVFFFGTYVRKIWLHKFLVSYSSLILKNWSTL
jgi:hypothetical protein